jgi:hypothetical protein
MRLGVDDGVDEVRLYAVRVGSGSDERVELTGREHVGAAGHKATLTTPKE